MQSFDEWARELADSLAKNALPEKEERLHPDPHEEGMPCAWCGTPVTYRTEMVSPTTFHCWFECPECCEIYEEGYFP